jgi:hypothetical protein
MMMHGGCAKDIIERPHGKMVVNIMKPDSKHTKDMAIVSIWRRLILDQW